MVYGADWAGPGWVLVGLEHGAFFATLVSRFEEVLARTEGGILVVDVPIGLPERASPGGRAADRAARKLLPKERKSSVFPTPSRQALGAESFEEARRLNAPAGLNRQTYALFPVLREVDRAMRPELQERVYEGHPELSFLHLAGPALVRTSKRDRRGLLRRNEVLAEAFGPAWQALFLEVPLPPAKKRDLVDAGALLWTAQRIARGEARYVPEPPDEDARGLRMAIYF